MKKYIVIAAGLTALLIVILSFRPVPIVAENDCLVLKGTVSKIYEGGDKDVVFELRGQNKIFYVNRGLERGMNLAALRSKLIGREVVLKYPDLWWSLLDPYSKSVHISKIEYAGHTIFTELN